MVVLCREIVVENGRLHQNNSNTHNLWNSRVTTITLGVIWRIECNTYANKLLQRNYENFRSTMLRVQWMPQHRNEAYMFLYTTRSNLIRVLAVPGILMSQKFLLSPLPYILVCGECQFLKNIYNYPRNKTVTIHVDRNLVRSFRHVFFI